MSFTPKQNACYRPLTDRAWIEECKRAEQSPNNKLALEAWYRMQLNECAGVRSTAECDAVKDFDKVMLHFAILAGDEYWINRLSSAAERRMMRQIRLFMGDLAWLEKETVTWDYIRAIYKQAKLPKTLDDCPVFVLWKVLQMLDTHIRRICRDYGIRPMELPSRAHPVDHPVPINTDNHRLAVGHDLDHSHATAHPPDEFPF